MFRFKASALLASLFVASMSLNASILSEGFDNISTLTGAGWVQVNNSTAGGSTSWFQGNTSAFPSQAGAANSYIAANFNNAGFGGNISDWLILPALSLDNGDVLTFYTRTESFPFPGDELQVRLSTNGASTNVGATPSSLGDFTNLLLDVGASGFPSNWTLFSVTISGLPSTVTGRLAFRYLVTDTSQNGDIVGIDSVSVTGAVPEPASLGLMLLGAGALGLARRRRVAR